MRKSGIYFICTGSGITIFALFIFCYPLLSEQYQQNALQKKEQLVQRLGITDLCLFTEAPYTRHLSQADNFAAFKDSPLVYEHFPSGSMTTPPQLARNGRPILAETEDVSSLDQPDANQKGLAARVSKEDILMKPGKFVGVKK